MTGRSDTGPFALVPEWVLYHPELSDRATRLYGALSRHADDSGVSWPRRKRLAELLSCSPDSVDRASAELEAIGALERSPRYEDGRQTSNLYRIVRVAPTRPPLGNDADGEIGTGADAPLGTGAEQNESQLEREPVERPGELPLAEGEKVSARRPARVTKDRARRTDPRSDELTRAWWESRDPRPIQPYPAARGVVSTALGRGWSPEQITAALSGIDPPLSGGSLDWALRHKFVKPANPTDDWDRSQPGGAVDRSEL